MGKKSVFLIAIMVLILTIAFMFFNNSKQTEITNFEGCIKAGNPIMATYPRQCRVNNQIFVEQLMEANDSINIRNSIISLDCSIDDDCILADPNGFKCCWEDACEEIDYGDYIAVAKESYENAKELSCPSTEECGPGPGCPVRIINQHHTAKCINKFCAKI
jgi:hypothetical protein